MKLVDIRSELLQKAKGCLVGIGLGCVATAAMPTSAQAGEIIVHVGPPSVGQGGSNPLSVPPINPVEYEVEWISPKGFEANFGITPGLLFGARSSTGGLYVGFGGGLVIDANGVGPGAYSSFGYNIGKRVFFNMELKQAIGISLQNNSIISPYALRVGMGFRW